VTDADASNELLAMRPKLAAKAKLRLDPKTGKYVLLYPEKGLLLNPTGAAILQLCSGERALFEIVKLLGEQFRTLPEQLQPEVLVFVRTLLDRGLLQVAP
jgi:pyrroloquinoline quinone biosynthesis protein D